MSWLSLSRCGSTLTKSQNQQLTTLLRATFFLCCLAVSGVSSNAWTTQSHVDSNVHLLMIDSDDCPYCRKFDREIAPIYPKTEEGKRAPLARHKLGDQVPARYASLNITGNTMTPTFILVSDNQEVDRLIGYNGDEFFWFLLSELLDKLKDD